MDSADRVSDVATAGSIAVGKVGSNSGGGAVSTDGDGSSGSGGSVAIGARVPQRGSVGVDAIAGSVGVGVAEAGVSVVVVSVGVVVGISIGLSGGEGSKADLEER